MNVIVFPVLSVTYLERGKVFLCTLTLFHHHCWTSVESNLWNGHDVYTDCNDDTMRIFLLALYLYLSHSVSV